MSEQEKFLERWSRRKRQADEESAREVEHDSAPGARDAEQGAVTAPATPSVPQAEPPFDAASLPPLESIVANSDIRAFLRPGVPAGLTRAALRRAWSADPAIRDFIGLSENSWDFTAPNGVPGFGPLDPAEVPRLLAEVFGPETREKVKSALEAVERVANNGNPADSAEASTVATAAGGVKAEQPIPVADQRNKKELSERMDNDVAVQNDLPQSDQRVAQARRGHGGALPE